MKNLEIEIQVQVEKIAPLRKLLEGEGKKLEESRQIDIYYTPKHRNFIAKKPVNEWLRLRDSGGKYSITYKNWHHDKDGKSRYCDEYETEIEDLKQTELLFRAIDIKEIARVDKVRLSYKYKKYHVSIDKVKKLGDFVEIEYKGTGTSKDAKKITDGMIEFLKANKVGKIYRNYVGYPFQILFPKDIELEEY